tara:strand:+ start:43 stop:1005 length:963 start_codon:yes stop_codon:yes gene_type:complete
LKKVIIISGPTASGKTKVSLELLQKGKQKNIPFAIVNFDSLLFYNELNIGTAKPTTEELAQFPHHMVNIASITNPLNASDYYKKAIPIIQKLHENNIIPILVGGSGFYLRSLIKGMYKCPTISNELKEKNEILFQKEGIRPFLEILKKNDPYSYKNLHPNDSYRIIRATEFFQTTGTPISTEKSRLDSENPYDFSNGGKQEWKVFHSFLDVPKEQHQIIIEKRTKQMIKQGLIDEVKLILRQGFKGDEKPLQSIGYKETLQFIEGKFDNQDSYIERINISTRQLAKSQRTFFKKVLGKETFNPLVDIEEAVNKMTQFSLE